MSNSAPRRESLFETIDRVFGSNYMQGVRWFFSGRRIWPTAAFYVLFFSAVIWRPQFPGGLEKQLGGTPDTILWMLLTTAAAFWALVLKGRQIRRGKERIKVADDYLAMREERMRQEFADLCVRFLEEQEKWKERKMCELYEQILDQVERDVLRPRRAEHDDLVEGE